MKVFPYPFDNRKISKNVDQWVPLKAGESYIALLNPYHPFSKAHGILITSRRVVEFEKSTIEHDLLLNDIGPVMVEVEIDENNYAALTLKINGSSGTLEQRFTGDEWNALNEFLDYLGKAAGKSYDAVVKAALEPRRQKFLETVDTPLAQMSMTSTVPLHSGETYLVYHANRIAAGTLEYALTNKRLVEYNTVTGIAWEVPLSAIKSCNYGVMGYLQVFDKAGNKRTMFVENVYHYEAFRSLIDDARRGRLDKKEKPARTAAELPPLHYPLDLLMESRGWMEGFKYEVYDAEKKLAFLAECRDKQTMYVARGDVIVAVIRMVKDQEHYRFETADGQPAGEIKKLKEGFLSPESVIILDGQGDSVGTVDKKPGVKAWASRAYYLLWGGQPALEMHCEFQHFRTGFKIDKLRTIPEEIEQMLLNCAFVLRLLEPDIMEDPIRGVVKDIRGDFKDSVDGLF
ncbi:MAG: hypothetical protein JXJ17_18445 [Anaerolineae bacterium]|nr:hypothetical protein [Anaerolineae bacterium]